MALKKHLASRTMQAALVLLSLVSSTQAQYKEYPQPVGKAQLIRVPELPSWTAFDLEVRERQRARRR